MASAHNLQANPYNHGFYEAQVEGSSRSARLIVPVILEFVRPRSVLDVGCGRGAWLSAFAENGVAEILGLDGDYLRRDALLIPAECFNPTDLRLGAFAVGRKFDLAISVEVAEHLPRESAAAFVRGLAAAAPVVLFSAAIPGQGGVSHVNEQWPAYWHDLFARVGYECIDAIRPRIWQDVRIEWWYRQNIFLYADLRSLPAHHRLAAAAASKGGFDFHIVYTPVLRDYVERSSLIGRWRRLARRILKMERWPPAARALVKTLVRAVPGLAGKRLYREGK